MSLLWDVGDLVIQFNGGNHERPWATTAARCLGFGLQCPPPLAPPGENPPFGKARFGYLVRNVGVLDYCTLPPGIRPVR